MARRGPLAIPWFLVQSADDAVTVPLGNLAFFARYANNPLSRVVLFVGAETDANASHELSPAVKKHIMQLLGFKTKAQVLGLTHTAVHISPDNPHYGAHANYRNCGGTARRPPELVAACLASDDLWYGLWGQNVEPGRAQGISTFNPNFKLLTKGLTSFIESALPSYSRD